MANSKFTLVIALSFIGLSGCMKINECEHHHDGDRDLIDQPVVFEFEYINHAWGYRHHGFFIEGDGQIRGYGQPKEWRKIDSSGYIRESDLLFNLDQADTVYGRAGEDDLLYHFGLIDDARYGKIKELDLNMADAGVASIYAYYRHEISGRLERVFLACSGDLNRENTSSAARMIVFWLKEEGRDIDRFHWYGGD